MPEIVGRRELICGKVVVMSPVRGVHGQIMAMTAHILLSHTEPRGLGTVWSGDTGIILARGPDTVRAPDVCFYAVGRLPSGAADQGYTDVVPDLIIEIASPTDRRGAIRRKTKQWLDAGARL